MTSEQLVEVNPRFFEGKLNAFHAQEAVYKQAIEHTKRIEHSELLSKARPNEPETVLEYRNSTVGMITTAPVQKFKTKIPRIFKSSGLSLNESSLSERLTENLNTKPYYYLNRRTDLMTFVYDCIFSESITDPNGLWLDFPFNAENPTISPDLSVLEGGLAENTTISLRSEIIPYSDIVYADNHIFSYLGGTKPVQFNGESKPREIPFYWVVDNEYWYSYDPVGRDEKGQTTYELNEWYRHDVGEGDDKELPINYLIGLLAKTLDGFHYQESVLSGFFHFADEGKQRYSDGKANWIQHCYPVTVMKEIDCPECKSLGRIKSGNKDKQGNALWDDCNACGTTGHIIKPHQYGVIVEPARTGMDEGRGGDTYRLVTPPTDLLQQTYDIPFDLIDKGKAEIGLNILEKIAESGTAKGMRLQPLKDILHLISDKIAEAVETHAWHRECYLNGGVNGRANRQRPTVNRPVDFDLKTLMDLKDEAENALTSDKLLTTIRYSERLYKNDVNLKRALRLMYNWVPTILLEWQEVRDQLNAGIIDANEVIRRNNAQWIFTELSQSPAFSNWTDEQVFTEANNLVEPLLSQNNPIEDQLRQLINAQENPLANEG